MDAEGAISLSLIPNTLQSTVFIIDEASMIPDDTGTGETATNCVAAAVALDTDTFVNVTGGSEDFHLAAGTGSALYGTGAAPGGSAPLNYTTDIDGETVATWCIGADSRPAAASFKLYWASRQAQVIIGGGLQ